MLRFVSGLLLLIFPAIATAGSPAEQVAARPAEATARNGIHASPLLIAVASLTDMRLLALDYERVVAGSFSIDVTGVYGWGSEQHDGADPLHVWTCAGLIAPTYYPQGVAPGGLYLAPQLGVGYLRAAPDLATITLNVGLVLGWSWIIGPANIKLGIGAAYSNAYLHRVLPPSPGHSLGQEQTIGFEGVAPTADLRVGFVF